MMRQTLELEPQSAQPNRIPLWAAVLVILIAMAGGGWLVYKWAFASRDAVTADVIEVIPGGQGDRFNGRGNGRNGGGDPLVRSFARLLGGGEYAEGVSRQPSGAIVARQGDVFIRVIAMARGNYNIALDYLSRSQWVTPEQMRLHRLAMQLFSNADLASQIKLTDDQKNQIQALAFNPKLTAAEHSSLESVAKEWDKAKDSAAKTAAESKFLAAAARAGAAHLEETKAAMLARVTALPKILTQQQIDQARALFQGGQGAQATKIPGPAVRTTAGPTTRSTRNQRTPPARANGQGA